MPAKIFIVPTDTCLGIGCRLDDEEGYTMLYELKGRDNSKQLAVLVPSWDDLTYETTLTAGQINFLKTYKFPFTVVTTTKADFRDEYPIFDLYGYTTVGFRVGEACLTPESLSSIRSPIFLTSANKSGQPECKTTEEVQALFQHKQELLQILPGSSACKPPSNVIQFVGTTNELKYLRKNYPL